MPITAIELKEAHPEIMTAIEQESYSAGHDEGYTKGKEEGLTTGAEAERARIKSIDSLNLAGHEKLIEEMKYDGKTTASEAALRVLGAEQSLRETKLKDFKADSPVVVASVEAPVDVEIKKDFNSLVDDYQKEKGCSRTEAIKEIVATMPEAHAAYLSSINTHKKED